MNVYFLFILFLVMPYLLMSFIKSEKFSLWLFLFVIQFFIIGNFALTGSSVDILALMSAYSIIVRAFVIRAVYKMIPRDKHTVMHRIGVCLFWFSFIADFIFAFIISHHVMRVIFVNIIFIIYAVYSYMHLNYGHS